MSNPNLDHIFCDTLAALEPALAILRLSRILAFDCEGQALGHHGGSLSLLSFRTILAPPATNKTVIIDAITLSAEALRPVYDLLESDTVLKIVFDGRMDYSCLLHDHGVRLCHVLDLQLVNIKSRAQRGEGENEQINRLARVVSRYDLAKNRALYRQIHRLAGLRPCAEEHQVALPPKGAYIDHSAWLRRPVSAQDLTYATNDVLIIQRILVAFTTAKYFYPTVVEDSMRYVSLWSDKQPSASNRGHALLPLHVIDTEAAQDLVQGQCGSCERTLPRTCFNPNGWAKGTTEQCLVCRAVPLWRF